MSARSDVSARSDELLTKLVASSARIEERVDNVREDVGYMKEKINTLQRDAIAGKTKVAFMSGGLAVVVSAVGAWVASAMRV